MNHTAFHLDRHFSSLFFIFVSPAAFRFYSDTLFTTLFTLIRPAPWNFNQKMFVSLQETPLRHKILPMILFLIRNIWTLHSCRASLDPRISTTRISLTTLVKSTIQLTEIGLSLNHSRNGPVVDPTMNAFGSIALGSTTRLFPGITTTLNTINLQPVILSMITLPLTGLRYSQECGAPGAGNLCFLLPPAFLFGNNVRHVKPLFVLKRNASLLKKHNSLLPNNSMTTLFPAGQKRQAIENLEHLSVQYQVEALLHNFAHLDVSKVPMLQGLPAPQQEQLITGVVHTFTTYRDELHQTFRPDDPPGHSTASSSAPLDYFPPTDPISDGTGLPLPLPDSGSMSLNSTSTESQNTLEPPFPLDRPRE